MLIKDSTYSYLLSITSDMLQNEENRFDIFYDTAEFWTLAEKHKLHNCIAYNQTQHCNFNSNIVKWEKEKYDAYIKELLNISINLKDKDITHIFVKGIFLSKMIYGDWYYRNLGDIDIIVSENDFYKAFYIMRELGYELVGDIGNDKPKLILGINFCEMKMFKGDCRVEIKRGVSAIDTNFNHWLSNSCEISLNNITINTLDLNHTILLLFAQAFINNEGKVVFYKCRLREYFDVAYMIFNHIDISWKMIKELSYKYELTHEIYSVLKSVDQIYNLPEKFIKEIFPLFNPQDVPYKKSFFYYNEDKNMEYNEGLLFQEFRANALYGIFDRDFSTYQYIKNYKAVLYSKKNDEYNERSRIYENDELIWKNYNYNNDKISMTYAFSLSKNYFTVDIKLNINDWQYLKDSNFTARVAWYDNDVTSCMLQRYVDSDYMNIIENIGEATKYIPILTRDYYSYNSEYSKKILQDKSKIIKLKEAQNSNCLHLEFIFPNDFLYSILDIIAFEVKIMIHYNESKGMSLGSVVDVIEIKLDDN